jgi:tripartite-type tricarboxylate transporter receptor subunit TctC
MRPLSLEVCCVALVAWAAVPDARSQERFPARPLQLIVPATAGGPVDTAARILEPGLAAALRESIVLLNKPGASGTVGMQAVATAEANGYTIGQGVNSIFTITRAAGTSVAFTLDNFTLLGNYATDVSVLAVHPESPLRTFDELTAYVRNNPGKLTYASAGVGTVSALSMEALRHHFNLDITGVPFQGGAQLTVAILGRHVGVGMVPYSTGGAMFREGKLRGLLTTASTRLSVLPDIPTLAEKGIDVTGLNLVMGIYAPSGLPTEVEKVLVNGVRRAADDPAVVAKFSNVGLFIQYEDPVAAHRRLVLENQQVVDLYRRLQR